MDSIRNEGRGGLGSEHGGGISSADLLQRLRDIGWHIGGDSFARILDDLVERTWIQKSGDGRWMPGPDVEAMSSSDIRLGGLARWLGSLVRTVTQRYERKHGSLLWFGFLNLQIPVAMQYTHLMAGHLQKLLDEYRVPFDQIQRGDEHRYAAVTVCLAAGDHTFQSPPYSTLSPFLRALLGTVASDVAVAIGDRDRALRIIKRHLFDALRVTAQQEGAGFYRWVKEHYSVASDRTIASYTKGERLDSDVSGRVIGGGTGFAKTWLLMRLGDVWPGSLSFRHLLSSFRSIYDGDLATEKVLRAGLSRLLAEDHIIRSRNERNEEIYTRRDRAQIVAVHEMEQVRTWICQLLPLVASVAASIGDPYRPTGSIWTWRGNLERDAVAALHRRLGEELVDFSDVPNEGGYEKGLCAFLQSSITAVRLKKKGE